MEVRQPTRVVAGQKVTDGGGVRLHRVLGTQELEDLDPFLLLDEFRSDDPGRHGAGFPDHPHRGIETVTYLLVGAIRHGDSEGNSGRLTPGDVQWMTAGRGIVHSEMPERSGLIWGFQLWVNLSARDKMTEPRYREIKAAQIPTVVGPGGAAVKVIAGEMDGASRVRYPGSPSIRSISMSRCRREDALPMASPPATRRSPMCSTAP